MGKDLKSLNRELQRKIEALSRVNHDLSTLLECAQAAALFLNHRLRIYDFTPALGTLLALPRPAGMGTEGAAEAEEHTLALEQLPVRFYQGGAEIGAAELPFKTVLATRQPLHDRELRLVRSDGGHSDVRLSAAPLLDKEGAVRGLVAVFTEITELNRNRRLAENLGAAQRAPALAKAEERMRQAERLSSLGALAAGMAHEINNPLNAILMNAELGLMSLEKKTDPERLIQILRRIIDDAKRGGSITRNVVQFARADNYAPQGLGDLNEIIVTSRKLVASMLQRYDVALHFELEPDLPKLELHQTALEQAVVNLINYAVKSGASQVKVRTARDVSHVRLTISDDGPRIPSAEIGYVFDPFFTTRREGGSGAADLSLSLVHRIISDHAGTIDVENLPEGGVRFGIKLLLPPNQQGIHA